jgi:D-alanyl-D-alanine carboxypeptidase (penicillin-binding protein 5/6)
MIFPRRCILAAFLLLTPLLLAANAKKQPTRPAAKETASAYRGAIVVDAATGNVLFEDHADIVSPPASMTKLMTFAVLHDRLATKAITLATPIRITNEDARMAGTQVYLDPRETFPVEELIYAMMIQSANDAAHALARASGGSREAFVALMNEKAKALGMANTTFRTPHGLPPDNRKVAEGDLSTPRDYALLCRHLLQNTDVLKYTSVRNRPFGEGVRAQPMAMTNHNHLLEKFAGVDGLKTGFTNGAGFCLSATAQRNGRRVIVVTMGAEQAKARDLKVAELLERGFAALPPAPPPAPLLTDSPLKPAPRPATAAPSTEPAVKLNIPKKK